MKINPLSRNAKRWLLLLPASLLLHFVVLRWGGMQIALPRLFPETTLPPLAVTAIVAQTASTLSAANEPSPVKTPAVGTAKPTRKPAPRKEPPSSPPVPLIGLEAPGPSASPPSLVLPEEPTGSEVAGAALSDSPANAPAGDTLASTAPAQPQPNSTPVQDAVKRSMTFNIPPSAELSYQVEALREGQNVHGHGKISWQADDAHYRILGEAGVLFFKVLEFTSEGTIDATGVAPELYTEKRFRKSQTNTHFQRERQQISFSASTASYPRQGGEQDRASIIWQLAAVGRGDASRFAPGNEFDIFVAAVRDGETWHLRVVGEEPVETGDGSVQAWRIVREPRAGSYEQRLDIWLAPQREWYPVQLKFTEKNGDYLTMPLSSISAPSSAALPASTLPASTDGAAQAN